jgi:hypothetical protein
VSGNTHQPDLATLRAIVEAVRRDPPPARRATQVAPAPLIALLALLLAGFLHARAFHAWTPRPASVPPAKEFTVKFAREMAVVSSFALASSCLAQDAVQWRVQDGGNGHWYQLVERFYQMYNWNDTRILASNAGGDLACFESSSEWLFIRSKCTGLRAYLSGGVRNAGTTSEWRWISGPAVSYFAWNPGAPNNGTSQNLVLVVGRGFGNPKVTDGWDDWQVVDFSDGYIIEWSADCNADGIVDYGQIRAGELDDADADNIPDCCESGTACDCVGDIDRSGAVNGVDLSIILNAWGVGGGKYPEADVNGDGAVDAIDLSFVLNAWGPCN